MEQPDLQPSVATRGFWLRALDYWNVVTFSVVALIIAAVSLLTGYWLCAVLALIPARVAFKSYKVQYDELYSDDDQPIDLNDQLSNDPSCFAYGGNPLYHHYNNQREP